MLININATSHPRHGLHTKARYLKLNIKMRNEKKIKYIINIFFLFQTIFCHIKFTCQSREYRVTREE